MLYLTEKTRIPRAALAKLQAEINTYGSVLEIVSLDTEIALSLEKVERAAIAEMPDRIIAATALHFDLPLITRDLQMQAHYPKIIW